MFVFFQIEVGDSGAIATANYTYLENTGSNQEFQLHLQKKGLAERKDAVFHTSGL